MRVLIFDFDGTLVPSQTIVYEVLQEMSQDFGFEMPSVERLRNTPTRKLIRELGIPFWKVPWMTHVARKKWQAKRGSICIPVEMQDLLRKLSCIQGNVIALVSSNSRSNVIEVLRKSQCFGLFERIDCGSSLFGKKRKLQKILREYSASREKTFSIGDEVRDIEAAHGAGVTSVAVGWGFHSSENLKLAHPDFFFQDFVEFQNWILTQ